MKNLISVIINFHNGEKFLEKSVKSVLDQNYKDLELILWDNASTDNSKNIVDNFQDKRIKYYKNSNKDKLYKARNKAISYSNGKFIAFLDCDDWWENNYLSSREEFFTDPSIDFYYCNTNLYYEKTNKKKIYKKYSLPGGKIYSALSKDYFLIISGVIFKKEIFSKYGFFDENYNILGDYDFFMRIAQNSNAHSTNLALINYRVHEKNYSRLNKKPYFKEYQEWLNRNVKENKDAFRDNINIFNNKLNSLEIDYLLHEKKKDFSILKKIFKCQNFNEILKFIILFLTPKRFYKIIKK